MTLGPTPAVVLANARLEQRMWSSPPSGAEHPQERPGRTDALPPQERIRLRDQHGAFLAPEELSGPVARRDGPQVELGRVERLRRVPEPARRELAITAPQRDRRLDQAAEADGVGDAGLPPRMSSSTIDFIRRGMLRTASCASSTRVYNSPSVRLPVSIMIFGTTTSIVATSTKNATASSRFPRRTRRRRVGAAAPVTPMKPAPRPTPVQPLACSSLMPFPIKPF